jgi:hypothetical protein
VPHALPPGPPSARRAVHRTALLVSALGALVLLQTLLAGPLQAAGAAPRPPTRAACSGPAVWKDPSACGWPDRSTTGPKKSACGRHLAPMGGGPADVVRLTTPGQKVRCRTINGCVEIAAHDVTLQDVKVRCTSGRTGEDANGTGVVTVEDGASATLRRVTLRGMDGNHACVWHEGAAATLVRIDCAGVNDGIFAWSGGPGAGDHLVVKNSFVHDLTTRTANGHVDGFQTEGASHGRLVHNTWLMTTDADDEANSAIAIWDSLADSDDWLVARNLIAGGGFAVYAEDYDPSESAPGGGHSVTDVRFVDNVFSTHLFACVGYYGVWYPRGAPTDAWQRSGNRVLETGQDVDGGNPSAGGRPCT